MDRALSPEPTHDLNPAQREAVEHPGGPLLVLAGAGSGKTRVLTARVARLLALGVPPEDLVAFTFTNRAAREMRERIARATGEAAERVWIGTFHGTAVRLLRREWASLGLPRGFVIYDREDQEGVLRELLKRLTLPEPAYRLSAILGRISDAKNALVDPPEMLRLAVSAYEKQVAECYRLYQEELKARAALDFDDLIAESVRLFLERPEVGARYQRRFQHVLVDEYQDTNHAQFRLVHALAAGHGNPFVVGDDDQSIYGWRGASLENILDFERAFPGARVVRLEQNYRSTGTILRAANAVIAHNQARKGKTLWSTREEGARLRFELAADEADEARRVRGFLDERVRRGGRLDQSAVLYRTNAQSRALETELRAARIPYEIVGGVSFFQRREVKDVLAYLRLAANPADAVSFWRIWNTPRRGLGDGARALVESRMAVAPVAPAEALRALTRAGAVRGAARGGAEALLSVLDELTARAAEPPDALVATLLERTRYLEWLERESAHDATERSGNVLELAAAAEAFAAEARGGLLEFLSEAALLTDADRLEEGADRVLLLTAHNAKGLEFDAVAVAGLEEGLFPHASSQESEKQLEEERRLFYVALTRARDEVLLTAAAFRRRYDGAWESEVSRFVDEIPEELLVRDEAAAFTGFGRSGIPGWGNGASRGRPGAHARGGSRGASTGEERARGRRSRLVGQRVRHQQFGVGVVVAAEGEGPEARCTVRFGTQEKRIVARFLTGENDVD